MPTPKQFTTPSGASFYIRKMRTEESFWLPIYHAQNVLDVGRPGTTFVLTGADTIAQARAVLTERFGGGASHSETDRMQRGGNHIEEST